MPVFEKRRHAGGKMDPLSLRLFVRTVEEGRITAVAASEHIAAAAVSKRLSELEQSLNAELLTRTNRGVVPTAAGLALLSLARRALRGLDDIPLQMKDFNEGVRGDVRVYANISSLSQFLPQDLKRFTAQHPQVNIHLDENVSTRTLRAVAENAADIGIFTFGDHSAPLEILNYRRDRLALLVPGGHPLRVRTGVRFVETLDHFFIGMRVDSALSVQMARAAAEADRPLRIRMNVASYDVLAMMVDAGLGLALMPEDLARQYAQRLDLAVIRLEDPWAAREIKMCVRRYADLSPAARLLVDHLGSAAAWQDPALRRRRDPGPTR
ncbi:Transcriptional regulator, LysR-family [uncultured Alphaproteobacteria bacterium]|uniref:Transcriptional regulator, LysR-family n=1 Tax=uncultured Alphaproteobacteria bacterium TaxID=91750 RepID=A0A212K517_9PROT|nr:Transcriptional regulator, LysR-family [uncultured Alphaproteobacteria bacterium]